MQDRTLGALEALTWVLSLIERKEPPDVEEIEKEVRAARNDLLRNTSLDFKHKIHAML
jgi:hypothetical protein